MLREHLHSNIPISHREIAIVTSYFSTLFVQNIQSSKFSKFLGQYCLFVENNFFILQSMAMGIVAIRKIKANVSILFPSYFSTESKPKFRVRKSTPSFYPLAGPCLGRKSRKQLAKNTTNWIDYRGWHYRILYFPWRFDRSEKIWKPLVCNVNRMWDTNLHELD